MPKINVGDRVRLTDKCTYITCRLEVEDAIGEVVGTSDSLYPYRVEWGGKSYSLTENEITKASAIYLGGE